MSKLLLPRLVGERYEIIKALRKLDVLVAGADQVDIVQLRDILEKEQELAREKRIAKPVLTIAKRKEVGKVLKEYLAYLKLRKAGSQHKFY